MAKTSHGNVVSLSILGSTGSVGTQTLDVIRRNPERFSVLALAAGSNVPLLVKQIDEFKPQYVSVASEEVAEQVRNAVSNVCIESGAKSLCRAATLEDVQIVLAAVSGFRGLQPVLSAIECGKYIALANKECLAAAGPLIRAALVNSTAKIVPVDSEHSSIFQCLHRCGRDESLRRVFLTATGGPFLRRDIDTFAEISPADAIKHPRWNMGAKISVDSATLMNKGLEVLEAYELFQLHPEQIEVLVHPEAIVHGLVEFHDGALLAAMFEPDMRVPIAFALSYLLDALIGESLGLRRDPVLSGASWLELSQKRTLTFEEPDVTRFPALNLCYEAMREGGSAGAVLNAANEIAVEAFLGGKISFPEIPEVVRLTRGKVVRQHLETLEDVVQVDALARVQASNVLQGLTAGRKS